MWHENRGQGGGAFLSRGAPNRRSWGGGSVALPFLLRRRRESKKVTEGSMWYSCNLSGQARRKSQDSVCGVSESANCTWRENRGVQSLLFMTIELMEPLPIRACTTIWQYVRRSAPVPTGPTPQYIWKSTTRTIRRLKYEYPASTRESQNKPPN